MTTAQKTVSLGDRYAETAVVIVTLLALLAGWLYKSSVENRSLTFESDGIIAEVPKGWFQSQSESTVIQVTDPTSAGFATMYAISRQTVANDVSPAQAASFQNLDLGQQLTDFRVLDQQPVLVNGQEAYQVSYVFVESDPNLARDDIPSVVLGRDYTFVRNGQAITVSYRADEHEFEPGLNRFYRFLSSVQY
ncbi:MAG TPA: hypothetical protein VJ821_00285 [Anaerolineales bacterium]|nr:hypothetical protein [Anaerolineales bacterium]